MLITGWPSDRLRTCSLCRRMRELPNRWIWTGAGAAALAAAGVGGAVVQRRHGHRIESDPENDALRDPPSGRPLALRSADGTALHAEVFGPDDGTTVVLAHGWTEMLDYWTYVIRDLTGKGFRVVAYDLRGHGDSDPAVDGDYADRALRRGSRGGAGGLCSRGPASRRGRPLARRDVDRVVGRASRRRTAGVRRCDDQYRRRRPHRRVTVVPGAGVRQGDQQGARRPRLPGRTGTASAHFDARELRGDPLHRVRAGSDPGADRLLRADARRHPARRACQHRDCDVRARAASRARAHHRADAGDRRRERPANATVACAQDRRHAPQPGQADRPA